MVGAPVAEDDPAAVGADRAVVVVERAATLIGHRSQSAGNARAVN